ncbi:hypothetical protein MKW94_013311 [Papaver nudicaule]|uniref:Uncharacterized protein n=1 Tax=Papaver nudicaule TaxID=74823 RepID=A0AA41SBX9_PAPNU|nr:hypothetical protein [Papaver nudicaule]
MSFCGVKLSAIRQHLTKLSGGDLCRALAVAGLVLYAVCILVSNPSGQSTAFLNSLIFRRQGRYLYTNTDINDLVFGIASSASTWRTRRQYIEGWWQPNITRGYVFFDVPPPKEYMPWSPFSPPYRVSENISRFKDFNKHAMPFAVRMVRVIKETFLEVPKGVKWYVMADDDTVLFIDNLVEILSKYDHNEYYYIGCNSEAVGSNADHSFRMAFGGAGYALSYPLAKALARNLDDCIKRYPNLYGSDLILQSCISDLGVSLTLEPGFHQIDLHGDISGFLSAHPQTPIISLHHLDYTNPLYPAMNVFQSLKLFMNVSRVDSSRLLQQSICYQKKNNWTFSISWGYSALIYENIFPPSNLERPLQTFVPWRNVYKPPAFMFNTRWVTKNPCETPHFFFLDSVEQKPGGYEIVTNYGRKWDRRLPACSSTGNHSADWISQIRVISPAKRYVGGEGKRRECCDIARIYGGSNITEIRLRSCMEDEIIIV